MVVDCPGSLVSLSPQAATFGDVVTPFSATSSTPGSELSHFGRVFSAGPIPGLL